MNARAIVIGVSAGGFKALHTILPCFGPNLPMPVIVVQHRREDEDQFFAESLNAKCPLSVTEARDKEPIRPGNIYIAPGGYHLLVEKEFSFALSVDEPVCYSRPSIDVLFESAADACGPHLVGIILTGANSDGSDGIVAIKRNGGYTIAQDPATASSYYMPQSAIDTDAVDTVLPLDRIPAFVNELVEDANG